MDGYVIPTENGTAFLDRAIKATEGPNPRGTDSTGETGAASSFDTINNQLQQFNYDPAQTTSYQEALDNTLSADSPVLEQTAYLAGSDASARGFGRTSVGTDVATRAMLGEANKMASADILAQQFNVGERNKGYQDMFSAQANTYGNWQQDQESAKRAQMEIDATVQADLLAGQVELANTRKKMEADILMNEDLTPAVKDAYVRNTYNGFFDDIDSLYESATGEVNMSDTLYSKVKQMYDTEVEFITPDANTLAATPLDQRVGQVADFAYTKRDLTMQTPEETQNLITLVNKVGGEYTVTNKPLLAMAGLRSSADSGYDASRAFDARVKMRDWYDKPEEVSQLLATMEHDHDKGLLAAVGIFDIYGNPFPVEYEEG